MKAICEILRPSLRLYAAGELEDRSTLLRVRRHLDRCAACRRFLREHDALLRRVLAGACEASSGLGCWDARDAESAEDVDTRRERIARRGAAEAARRRRRILSRIEELPLPRADRRLRIPPPRSVLSSLSAAAALVFLALLAGLLWRQGDAERPAAPRRRLAALPAAAVASAASIARPERAAAQEPSLADLLWTRSSFHVAAELGLPRSASRVIVLHAFAAPDAGRAGGEREIPGAQGPESIVDALTVLVAEPPSFGVTERLLMVPAELYSVACLDAARCSVLRDAIVDLVPRRIHRLAGWSPSRAAGTSRSPQRLYRVVPAALPALASLPTAPPDADWPALPWLLDDARPAEPRWSSERRPWLDGQVR